MTSWQRCDGSQQTITRTPTQLHVCGWGGAVSFEHRSGLG